MSRWRICCCFLAISWYGCSPSSSRDDGEPIGTWHAVSLDQGAGPENAAGIQIVITRERVVMCRPDGEATVWGETARIDPSTRPREIDIRDPRGMWLGIYEVAGEDLKLVVNEPGEARPGKFRGSPKGLLFKMQRVK
jgi:uncharacterized protein (TIGR03067 family)